MLSQPTRPATTPQASRLQVVARKRIAVNRHASILTPEMRKRITEDCIVRGCVQTAKIWNVTVGVCLELRIEAMDKLLREAREWMARMERKAAA